MLPDRCSVTKGGRQCVSPPEFVVSVAADGAEYMVGVTCGAHKKIVAGKIEILQEKGGIREGKVSFSAVNAVGTDCIHADADDFVQIDTK